MPIVRNRPTLGGAGKKGFYELGKRFYVLGKGFACWEKVSCAFPAFFPALFRAIPRSFLNMNVREKIPHGAEKFVRAKKRFPTTVNLFPRRKTFFQHIKYFSQRTLA